jgi:hypothetical protein
MPVATNVYSGAAFPGNFNIGKLGIPGERVTVARYFDCTVRNLAAASHQVCAIPANSLVQVTIVPLTGEATDTLAWGDATTADSLKAAAAIATGVNQVTRTLHYAADNEVQFTNNGTLDAAKFFVIVDIISARLTAV